MHNLFKYENVLRVTFGILLVVSGTHFAQWWLFIPALMLIYTGAHNFCPIYNVLGINAKESIKNYYISQLPKYNPEPVFIYNMAGELKFNNANASEAFLKEVNIPLLLGAHHENNFFEHFNIGDKVYMVRFHIAKEIDLVLGYAFDATEFVALQKEIISTQKEIVYTMGEIGETRSKETGNHVKRVAEYSYTLAKLAGLDEEESELLKVASPMHDIGKVGIPDSVLKKPGKLDNDEWVIMKTHAHIGYELLKHSKRPILQAAAIVAKEHHEKWDGSGYPQGLSGADIHMYGRITAIADVFDALGSERVYKKAWEMEKILELFSTEKGKHFDPRLVELFFTHLEQFIAIKERYKD
jgi:response regulator RpfG family c-di-GMP phosphodiesterase